MTVDPHLSRLVGVALAVLASVVFSHSAPAATSPTPPGGPRCADPCTCTGPSVGPKASVKGSAVAKCLANGRSLALKRVRVVGEIDLSIVPCARLEGPSPKVPGVADVRTGLALLALERKTGQRVPGSRLVPATVVVEDSEITGQVRGPVLGGNERVYCPLVFLQTVTLDGTVVRDEVRLPYARFRRPVTAVAAVFERPVDLRGATFAQNVVFNHARFVRVSAREAEFEGLASFRGVEVTEAAGFESVTFRGAAWFDGVDEARRLRAVDFTEARFEKEAKFEDAQFLEDARFAKVRFDQSAWFTRARFIGSVHFDETVFGGRTTFTRSIFERLANFFRAVFDSKLGASFGDAQFRDEARFQETRFGGPAEFVSTRFFTSGQFTNVAFSDAADFRDVVIQQTAEFGGGTTRTVFLGAANFAFAKLSVANFENAHFKALASFAGAVFGEPAPCLGNSPIVANLWGVSFDDVANFQDAEFRGGVNLSHTTVAPGRARLRWRQLDGVVESDSVVLVVDEKCNNLRQFRRVASRPAMPRAEVFGWLERNFRSLEQLRDANAAFYAREEEETSASLKAANLSYLGRTGLLFWQWGYGRTAGYGVFPGRIALIIVGVLLTFAVAYGVSSRPLRAGSGAPRIAFKVTELPWQAEDATPPGIAGPRWLLALAVSAAAILSVRVVGAHVVDQPAAWRWWLVAAGERALGYLLLVLLGMTIANSVPGVERFFSWLL